MGETRKLAAILVAEIGDVSRFRSAEALCSWAGLTPKHRESDTKVHRGGVTKQGSRLVRWAVIEGTVRYHGGGKLAADWHQLAERRGKHKATVAIARGRCAGMPVAFLRGDAFALPFAPNSFDGAFAGFWISHIRRSRLSAFLSHLAACLCPGARVVLLDNLYVAGNSTPIAERDGEGNTFQDRRLADGSISRVLKNFPTEAELCSAAGAHARAPEYRTLEFYWTFTYEIER